MNLQQSITMLNGAVDELSAVRVYVSQLIEMSERGELSDELLSKYKEIIGDELNHLEIFMSEFVSASGMSPKAE